MFTSMFSSLASHSVTLNNPNSSNCINMPGIQSWRTTPWAIMDQMLKARNLNPEAMGTEIEAWEEEVEEFFASKLDDETVVRVL